MFSRINTRLAIGDSTGQVHVIDVSCHCGSQQLKYAAHEGIISSLAYTACGQLFSGGND